MSKETAFIIYCLEIVKQAKRLTGKQVIDLFTRYDLFSFISEFYELLHVHGELYILQDIDEHIAEMAT